MMMILTLLAALIAFVTQLDSPLPDDAAKEASPNTPTAAFADDKNVVDDAASVFKTLQLSFPNPDKTGLLVIDINRGFVEVTGHDRPDVMIEVLDPNLDIPAGENPQLKPQFAPQFDINRDLATNAIKLDTYNQDYALNLRVKVPHKTDLNLDTYYDGYLQVNKVAGNIQTHSQNCDIRLMDITGTAKAFSYNGDLTIKFLELAPDAVLDFESYNGSIDLTLPVGTAATTAISAGTGTYYSAFESQAILLDEDEARKNLDNITDGNDYKFSTINGGGIPIRLESNKGTILLRKLDR